MSDAAEEAVGACPWCGKADFVESVGARAECGAVGYGFRYECFRADCLARGPFRRTKCGALAAWNRVSALEGTLRRTVEAYMSDKTGVWMSATHLLGDLRAERLGGVTITGDLSKFTVTGDTGPVGHGGRP